MERKILKSNIFPHHYDLHLNIDTDNLSYTGKETITVQLTEPTNQIALNSCDLEIVYAKVFIDKFTFDASINYEEEEEKVIFTFEQILHPDTFKMEIFFKGIIRNNMNGFYVSNYTLNGNNHKLFSTHFEPTAARQAFPCFDQPDMKAIFDIKLTHDKDLTSLSNMSVKHEEIDDSFKTVIFNSTPKMSTYLVAFVVGELDFVETISENNVKIRVYIPKGYNLDSAKFSLNVCNECLTFFESYFSEKYPMDKLDNVAIPEFSMGAMENWGLITYRMSSLLYDERNSSVQTKKRVAETVCHELAHQWFGNLVTMKWWNDLWLNEGFATWAAALGVSNLSKKLIDWDVWTSFIAEDVEAGMSYDSLESTHPVEVPVYNPNDINQIFDGISYSKGASLIRMLEDYVGKENFRNGLREYLEKFKYKNAITDDLWQCISKNLNGDEKRDNKIKGLMDQWTEKEGFPFISVEVDEENINLEQERFLLNNFNVKEKSETLWFIPLRIEFEDQQILLEMKNKNESFEKKKDMKYFKVNSGGCGFYRVFYRGDLFFMLQDMLMKDLLTPKDRLNLVNDLYSFVIANYNKITDFISLTDYFKNEENYDVLSSLLGGLNELKSIFYSDKKRKKMISDKILELISTRASNVDLSNPGSSLNEISTNALLISYSVANDDPFILKKLYNSYESYKNDKKVINPVFRASFFVCLMKTNPKHFYTELFDIYMNSEISDEKIMALSSLGSSSDKEIFISFLNESLEERIKLQDKIYIFFAAMVNKEYRNIVIDFVKSNFSKILSVFTGNSSFVSHVVEKVFGVLSEENDLNETKSFFENRSVVGFERSVSKIMERIEIRSTFRRNVENSEEM